MQSLHQFQEELKSYLSQQKFEQPPVELYRPFQYIMDLGGKRLRPVVLLMSYALFDANYSKAMPAALAIEVFHNFTLVHDDIMDDAPLRRGKPTVHEKYDLNTGILSGDVMLVKAYEYLLQIKDAPNFIAALEVFTQTCVEVCEGQQMDMNFETQDKVSIDEYLRMIELKTSVLVAGAMKMGALLADASLEEANLVYEFGRNLGVAFQIQDDLLDTFGDPEKFGKRVGGDIVQNKKTYLYLKALEVAPSEMKRRLEGLYNRNTIAEQEKIGTVIQVFNQLNIRQLAEEAKQSFQDKAMLRLQELKENGRDVSAMEHFAELLLKREQ